MSKKKNCLIVKEKKEWWPRIRPFLFPVLFGLGGIGAYLINVNGLMNKVQSGSNQGIQVTWLVQVCTYLCVIGLVVLGYQFESKLEKNENSK